MSDEYRAVQVLRQAGYTVDRRIKRVVKIDGAGDGLGHTGVVSMMPDPFVRAYERLVDETYSGRGQTEAGSRGAPRKGGLSRRAVIGDERAFLVKKNADRRLRRLANEIMADLGGLQKEERANRCPTCGRIGGTDWAYCPTDGQRMRLEEKG